MKKTNRKVDEQAKVEISNILMFEVSDPRLQFVTITGCKVSFDRAYAEVFYTTTPDNYADAEIALGKAKGHIRSVMARNLDWKKAPELRFRLDETIDNAVRIENQIESERERFGYDSEESEEGEL
ncbi:MAG: 30S ribosome-binding factor RbfA [Phoenicibacter congonensis]|uniref:Ribosome-binding factor A n=1 Tax=Phoenicibacter congonensis TaxID=1944646 RepID=A0AA43UA38_9ACTN|nr:30S ribosome-binding factor RbfA [Phoenicibacter congonensis]